MYPISDEAKALFESEQWQVLRITGMDRNGASINITEADVIQDGFEIDRYSCNGDKLEIGTAIAAELTLRLDNRDGRFKSVAFEGTELFVEVGIADWTQDSPTVHWIPCGYFTPETQPRSLNTITINAVDRMTRLDDVALPLNEQPWTNENGEVMTNEALEIIYFTTGVRFPVTVSALAEGLCNGYGLRLATDLSTLPNANLVLEGLPDLQQTITLRNLIQWCAGLMGTSAWIDWNGDMRFSWYDNATGYVATTANRFSSDLYETPLTITGVSFTDADTEKTVYLAGKDDYALDLSGNFFLTAENASTALVNIYNAIHDYAYTPFTATVINAPYLWPMDRIVFTDRDGVGHVSLLTNVNFTLNGNTVLAAKGETAQTNSRTLPGSFTAAQVSELKRTQRVNSDALNGAVERATAQITGATGGNLRDLYVDGKRAEMVIMDTEDINTATKVWRWNSGGLGYSRNGYSGPYTLAMTQDGAIVADFITTGTLDAALASIINLNASNITTGELSANRISGGTLSLGGSNNQSGLLRVLDASGAVIGSWSMEGISVTRGSLGAFTINSNGLYYGTVGEGNTGVTINRFGIEYTSTSSYTGVTTGAWLTSGTLRLDRYGLGAVKLDVSPTSGGFRVSMVDAANDTRSAFEISNNTSDPEVLFTAPYRLQVEGNARIMGDMSVFGTKSRAVSTDLYSDRLLYCYETPSPMFGDVGEGVIGADGKCYIWLDPVFAQTISDSNYQVFVQPYGNCDCRVDERRSGYFTVVGTPNGSFGWEIKAKQSGYDQLRLERNDEPFTVPEQTYGSDAARHLQELKKERGIA